MLNKQLHFHKELILILEDILSYIKYDMNELSIKEYINLKLKEAGYRKQWHPTVVKFDEQTLLPGVKYSPSQEKKFQQIGIIDIGVIKDGFELDYALTISSGKKSETEKLIQKNKTILSFAMGFIHANYNHLPISEIYSVINSKITELQLKNIGLHFGHPIGKLPTLKKGRRIEANNNAFLSPGTWMIEVHTSDGLYGAFHEDLINLK